MPASRRFRIAQALAVLALAAGFRAPARADPAVPIDLRERHAAEAKALLPLLRLAVKEDYRRQAWYLAWRVSLADLKNAEALAVLGKWREEEVLKGNLPTKTWTTKRDQVLRAEGDAYSVEARVWMGQGAKVADLVSLTERSLAYGTKAGDVLPALDAAGYGWAGTFGTQSKEAIESGIGPLRTAITFPVEWDDGYVYAHMLWPDAKILRLGPFSVVAGDGFLATCRRTVLLSALDVTLSSLLGSVAKDPKEDDPPVLLLSVPDATVYDRLGASLVGDDTDRARFLKSSTWVSWWHKKALALEKDRDNPWVGADVNFLHVSAASLLRHHLGGAGRLSGRGSWILEGLAGAFEGFVTKGRDSGDIEPGRCPRLAAARALRDAKRLLPWDQLFETDRAGEDLVPRADAKVKYRGAEQEGHAFDVVVCQATAFAMGLLRANDGKDTRKVGQLVIEALKRDRLPDVDKAMGWPKGRAVKEAEKVLDAVDGK